MSLPIDDQTLRDIEKQSIESSREVIRNEASIYEGSLDEFIEELVGGILHDNYLFDEQGARETIADLIDDLFNGTPVQESEDTDSAWDRAFGPLFD